MAMEFLDGDHLKELIISTPLELDRVVDIAVQVLDGLEAAHAEDVIHRDIKPANIFVTSERASQNSRLRIGEDLRLSSHG